MLKGVVGVAGVLTAGGTGALDIGEYSSVFLYRGQRDYMFRVSHSSALVGPGSLCSIFLVQTNRLIMSSCPGTSAPMVDGMAHLWTATPSPYFALCYLALLQDCRARVRNTTHSPPWHARAVPALLLYASLSEDRNATYKD